MSNHVSDRVSSLLRSNLVVALGTALSRVTGLVRVAVFAIVIGQTALADAYNGANNTPNAIYELLLGGVLSASLVPMFTRQAEDGDDEATSAVVTVAAIAMTALTVVAVVAAPLVFRLFSLDVADSVDADAVPRGRARARAHLPRPDLLLRPHRARQRRCSTRAAASSPRRGRPCSSNLVIIATLLLVPGTVDGREPELRRRAHQRPAALDARARRHGRHRGRWRSSLIPALRARRRARCRFRPELPPSRRAAAACTLSGWTLGYVVANQVAIIVVQNLARRRAAATPRRLLEGVHLLRAPPRPARRCRSPPRSRRRWPATWSARRTRRLHRAQRRSASAWSRCSRFPAGVGLFVLRRPIIGATLAARQRSTPPTR